MKTGIIRDEVDTHATSTIITIHTASLRTIYVLVSRTVISV